MGDKELENQIKRQIANCVENRKIYNFLLGNNGGFDRCCAKYVKDMKALYPQIKSFLVLAYLPCKVDDNDKEFTDKMFDEVVYPALEKVPKKYAILARNKWMVDNSDFIIFYVNHSWGGACKSLEYATRKHKNHINFGEIK